MLNHVSWVWRSAPTVCALAATVGIFSSAPRASHAEQVPTGAAAPPAESTKAAPADPAPAADERWGDYRSRRILLHTDIGPERAAKLLARLEQLLTVTERYYDQPLRGRIDCTVVEELDQWPVERRPHPQARLVVGGVGGATVADADEWLRTGEPKAMVVAESAPGVMEHELIHAYAAQTFDRLGPDWYKEGMAEVGRFWAPGARDVRCPPEHLDELRRAPFREPFEIARAGLTAPVADVITSMPRDEVDDRDAAILAWRERNAATLAETRAAYQWSWALCHFLLHNPNYAARFHLWGGAALKGQEAAFDDAFAAAGDRLRFEFAQFIAHVRPGYDVAACRWEWNAEAKSLEAGCGASARVASRRGWQPARVRVVRGQRYTASSAGCWTPRPGAGPVTTAGDAAGCGRLIAIVLDDELRLSDAIDLGVAREFAAPADGALYLRCQDAWHELSDNIGAATVHIERASPAPSTPGQQ